MTKELQRHQRLRRGTSDSDEELPQTARRQQSSLGRKRQRLSNTFDDSDDVLCLPTGTLYLPSTAPRSPSSARQDDNDTRKSPKLERCSSVVTTTSSSSSEDLLSLDSDTDATLSFSFTESSFLKIRRPLVQESPSMSRKTDLKTGLLYERASRHVDPNNRATKERPQRIDSIIKALAQKTTTAPVLSCKKQPFQQESVSLYDRCFILTTMDKITASPLTNQYLASVHTPGYLQRLHYWSRCSCATTLQREAQQFDSLYLTPDSVTEAKQAAASLCGILSQVINGTLDNAFAAIRPPGHHAGPAMAGGFGIINNVAVAANYARRVLRVPRVLIVDWDVHHGNGTQSIFLEDPNVMYFSVHRWHGGKFFPFQSSGGPSTVGKGEGLGFNVNVGWTRNGMGDDEYLAVWKTLLMPMAREFDPDLVLVSAGFDSAKGDDMGECEITPLGYAKLTRQLMTIAEGKVVMALEGGYVNSVLGRCVASVVGALLGGTGCDVETDSVVETPLESTASGKNRVRDILDSIDPVAAQNIRATITHHRPFWSCL